MATNRDIVATRKLGGKNKARLGRGGDTKIRKVDGRESHVNALEAYLIDVDRKAGEEYTKRVGSGEINPFTGMPEYQERKTYEELRNMSEEDMSKYLASWGITDATRKYIEDPRKGQEVGVEERFFAGQERDIAMDRAGDIRSLTERELGATRGFTEQQLGLQREFTEKGLAQTEQFAVAGAGQKYQMQAAGLAGQLESGQRGIGRNIAQARAGAESAAGKSGLARGSITSGFERQRADLMGAGRDIAKQYQLGRTQATRGLGMAQRQAGAAYQLGMEETAATQALGMEKAAFAFDIGTAAAEADYGYAADTTGLGYKQELHRIGKLGEAEEDKFYGSLGQHAGDPSTWVSEEGTEKMAPDGTVYIKNEAGNWIKKPDPTAVQVV